MRRAAARPPSAKRLPEAGPRLRGVLLDRHVDEVAPLRPRAVVVAHVALAEELVEDEPRVRRALADAAVGDDRIAAEDALAAVELAQLVSRLEGAVLPDRLRPRDRLRAGDVAAALGALLLVARHRDELARELLRRADVDEHLAVAERVEDGVALGADRVVARLGGERRRRMARRVARRLAALGDPLLARAVHELHVVVAVVLEVPVRVRREPVVAIAVEDDRVVVGDAARAEQLTELLRPEEVALDLVLQVLLPVEADGARDVRLGGQRRVLVDLDDPDVRGVQMLRHPLGVDEHVLRVVSQTCVPPAQELEMQPGLSGFESSATLTRDGGARRAHAATAAAAGGVARARPRRRAADRRRVRGPRRADAGRRRSARPAGAVGAARRARGQAAADRSAVSSASIAARPAATQPSRSARSASRSANGISFVRRARRTSSTPVASASVATVPAAA